MVVWNDLSNTQWLDYPSQSNILRRTYVNGFLDVSQNIVARKDLELKGKLKLDGSVEGDMTVTNMTIKGSEGYKWNPYGQVLSGHYETTNAHFGVSTDIDASGTTIVVGANVASTGAYANNGAVYVYRYDPTAEIWYQFGNTIVSSTTTANTSRFGRTVQISANGNRIAVLDYSLADLYFYDYNSVTNTWVSAGSIMSGNHGLSTIRHDQGIQLSGDGNTILFGDLGADTNIANSGTTLVYRNNSGTTWTKIGELHGSTEAAYTQGGAISYNGNRIYIGEKDYNFDSTGASLTDSGRAVIYDYDSGTAWNQVGDAIHKDIASGVFGYTGSMSNDGSIVAIHAYPTSGAGNISVYQYDTNIDGSWKQLGTTIGGVSGEREWGHGVKISNDGTTLVAGHLTYDGDKTNQGALYVYKYINGDWEQQGDIIVATCSSLNNDDKLGFVNSYAINGDGTNIVGGIFSADLDSSNSGAAQVWQWSKKEYSFPSINDNSQLTILESENVNNWNIKQLGQVLYGNDDTIVENNINTMAGMGASPSLNADGTILATSVLFTHNSSHNRYHGQILVFKYRNGTWGKIGTAIQPYTLNGPGSQVYTGWTLKLDNLGTTIAFCTYANSNGTLEVYKYFNGDWIPKGSTVGNYLHGASISGNGNVVAGAERTELHAYQYIDASNSWVRMGNDISIGFIMNINVNENDRRVDLNDTGDIMAIGYYGEDTSGTNTGSVFVYKYDGTFSNGSWSDGSWNLLGNEIYLPESSSNSTTADLFGKSVSLSSDGYTIVSTSANYEGNSGRARVLKYNENSNLWVPLGSDITLSQIDSAGTEGFANRACISGDGKTLLVNNVNSDKYATDAGSVSILKYIDGDWKEVQSHHHNVADDHYGMTIALSKDGKRFAGGNKNADPTGTQGFLKVHEIEMNPTLKVVNGSVNMDTVNTDKIGSIKNSPIDVTSNIYINTPLRYDGGTSRLGRLVVAGTISQVSTDFSSSTAIIRVSGTNASNNMQFGVGDATYNYEPWIQACYDNSTTTTSDHGVKKLRLNPAGGNIVRHGESSYSDDRVKINEIYISNATETLNKLKPQTYTRYAVMDSSGNIDYNSWSKFEAGLIAQEIYYDAPELRHIVGVPHDADLSGNDISTSDDAKVDPDYSNWGTSTASVEYTQLIPYLIKSNQEQQAEINTLKTENATLKTQMADVLARLSSLESAQTT